MNSEDRATVLVQQRICECYSPPTDRQERENKPKCSHSTRNSTAECSSGFHWVRHIFHVHKQTISPNENKMANCTIYAWFDVFLTLKEQKKPISTPVSFHIWHSWILIPPICIFLSKSTRRKMGKMNSLRMTFLDLQTYIHRLVKSSQNFTQHNTNLQTQLPEVEVNSTS